jgi:hypothetical protein
MTGDKKKGEKDIHARISVTYEEKMRELVEVQEKTANYLKKRGLGEIEQTKITLFLQSTKLANSLIIPKIEFQSIDWQSYKFFNQQMYKNMQSSYLLAKATKWTSDLTVYARYGRIGTSFWDQADIWRYVE